MVVRRRLESEAALLSRLGRDQERRQCRGIRHQRDIDPNSLMDEVCSFRFRKKGYRASEILDGWKAKVFHVVGATVAAGFLMTLGSNNTLIHSFSTTYSHLALERRVNFTIRLEWLVH